MGNKCGGSPEHKDEEIDIYLKSRVFTVFIVLFRAPPSIKTEKSKSGGFHDQVT